MESHEKPIHLFIVSEDLEYFSHEHPRLNASGVFQLDTRLPKSGTYKLLADFMPEGGTAQLISHIISTAGYKRSIAQGITMPAADMAPKHAENLDVELVLDPERPDYLSRLNPRSVRSLTAAWGCPRGIEWARPCRPGSVPLYHSSKKNTRETHARF
jgi:hypothetical protein